MFISGRAEVAAAAVYTSTPIAFTYLTVLSHSSVSLFVYLFSSSSSSCVQWWENANVVTLLLSTQQSSNSMTMMMTTVVVVVVVSMFGLCLFFEQSLELGTQKEEEDCATGVERRNCCFHLSRQ